MPDFSLKGIPPTPCPPYAPPCPVVGPIACPPTKTCPPMPVSPVWVTITDSCGFTCQQLVCPGPDSSQGGSPPGGPRGGSPPGGGPSPGPGPGRCGTGVPCAVGPGGELVSV
jgi:hypothetical protein